MIWSFVTIFKAFEIIVLSESAFCVDAIFGEK